MVLSEKEKKQKAVGQFKLQLNTALEPFMRYGFQEEHELPSAMGAITELAIQLAKRYSGIDVPISLKHAKEKAARRRSKK